MAVVTAATVEAAALMGAKQWPSTPFRVYELGYFEEYEADTELLVKGVRRA